MILNDAPANEAILSNVGEIGEFRIRNSAKAFNILSSGLYANKIRAVIRELSCNAVDSHVAADNAGTPFDVHLPTTLEPWFAVRDYGTGLTHEQVTNIYTTYFESSKTNSNAFIGALGLGSKSPFSYTDNFTVTAIKDGRKGIYSAFINGEGVPSIALMMEEESTEPSGVEVKMSVNDRYDFDKFRSEARTVYTHFSLRPVISGSDFEFRDVEYEDKDIVPGVHSYSDSRSCRAVMGNIAYPIDVPNAETNLGEVAKLLACGLEMHFAIGELDFQASREGLSYIPSTITAIKAKLNAVNDSLTEVLAKEANAIANMWDRAVFLVKKAEQPLWSAAVQKYVTDTSFAMVNFPHRSYARLVPFKLTVDGLAKKFNIAIRGFDKSRGQIACTNLKSYNEHKQVMGKPTEYIATWDINISDSLFFVINDTKNGATERAKYHWRNSKDVCQGRYSDKVIVIEAADKTKPVKTKAFFHAIANPPTSRTMMASSLLEKPRKDSSVGKNVTIMVLQERGYGGYYREREMVWKDAGKADSFDKKDIHYYLPLSGYTLESKYGYSSAKELKDDVTSSGVKGFHRGSIYGVRKSDIEFIKTQKNWVNFEDHIVDVLSKVKEEDFVGMVLGMVDNYDFAQYNIDIATKIENQGSPYLVLSTKFKDVEKVKFNQANFQQLTRRYANNMTFDPTALGEKFVIECKAVYARYPLLENLRYRDCSSAIAEYINLVDAHKSV
ncbi:hypothetical protein UFOVP71_331 [uncultured Caudovirales phage]|uniref:Uncharacterized protein n=1 Tax=uncultured Caudovirales phage TaxID=2100421 RepID=A0A6J5TAH2_9CAUD|nr:hypothetical protein UFOVP71_331 [uncultured Caudovirales phage]